MRRLDLDLLHTLVTIADSGSLTAAATRVARSQSAVSEQVRKLEEFCGMPLLSRGKKGIRLTPAGERLTAHARSMLLQNDLACQDLQGTLLEGDLHLAITDYFRPTEIATLIRRLSQQYPRLRFQVSVRKSAQIELDVGGNDFDIGLSMRILGEAQPTVTGAHRRIPLRRESLFWVASSTLEDNCRTPLPLVTLPETCSLYRYMTQLLKSHNIPYFSAHSATGVGGLQLALAAGLGIACLNSSAIPQEVSVFRPDYALPALPEVEFNLLVPTSTKTNISDDIAQILVEQFI